MGRTFAILAAALLLFAGAVWYAQRQPPMPLGYSGLQFSRLTKDASSRTPSLGQGALVVGVEAKSPAAKAAIQPGAVIAAIDSAPVHSADEAATRIGRYRVGETARLTVYPSRTLAKDPRKLPPMAANAAWSQRIARGASGKPIALKGFGTGRCNGVMPEQWRIIGYVEDGSLLQVAMPGRFQQALIVTINGATPDSIREFLEARFASPVTLSPVRRQPFGFSQVYFGNEKGGTGFVTFRVKD